MIPTASRLCKIKNISYFLTRRMYTDVPSIRDIMMMDCCSLEVSYYNS